MRLIIAFLPLFVIACTVNASVVEVPADFTSIQEAIESVAPGDTVLVSEGTYVENINFRGKDIVVCSQFLMDGDVSHIPATIIDGSDPSSSDTAACVMIIGGETAEAKLCGFTLTGGDGSRWWDPPTSAWYREGGGILIDESAPTIEFNIIDDNDAISTSGVTSAGGGGIRIGFGEPLIQNNVIVNNRGRYGGGIVVNYADPIIRNNVIAGNAGGQDFGGAGIWMYGNPHTAIVENNCIIGNHATGTGSGTSGVGGGMMIWSVRAEVRNNIIWANEAPNYPQIRRTSAIGPVKYNLVEGGWSGDGNFDDVPSFTDFTSLLLNSGSPCVDTGDTTEVYNDIEDAGNPGFALYPSLGTTRNDLGIYGGPYAALLPPFVIGTLAPVIGNPPAVESFALHQNYPNPFNPETTISFTMPVASHVNLTVYDITGRVVKKLLNDNVSLGSHKIAFDASALPSGIYFYTLESATFSSTRKMVLLK